MSVTTPATHVVVHSPLNDHQTLPVSESAAALVGLGLNPSEPSQVDAIRTVAAAAITGLEGARDADPALAANASSAIDAFVTAVGMAIGTAEAAGAPPPSS